MTPLAHAMARLPHVTHIEGETANWWNVSEMACRTGIEAAEKLVETVAESPAEEGSIMIFETLCAMIENGRVSIIEINFLWRLAEELTAHLQRNRAEILIQTAKADLIQMKTRICEGAVLEDA
jgi:hypothetical protein